MTTVLWIAQIIGVATLIAAAVALGMFIFNMRKWDAESDRRLAELESLLEPGWEDVIPRAKGTRG